MSRVVVHPAIKVDLTLAEFEEMAESGMTREGMMKMTHSKPDIVRVPFTIESLERDIIEEKRERMKREADEHRSQNDRLERIRLIRLQAKKDPLIRVEVRIPYSLYTTLVERFDEQGFSMTHGVRGILQEWCKEKA